MNLFLNKQCYTLVQIFLSGKIFVSIIQSATGNRNQLPHKVRNKLFTYPINYFFESIQEVFGNFGSEN